MADEPPPKRFKYTSYNQQINSISVDVGKKKNLTWEREDYGDNVEQSHTPFTSELSRLTLLDLTVPFHDLQKSLEPLTRTLPIILLNLEPVSNIFFRYYSGLKDGQDHLNSGLASALFLHQAVYETCLGEALPYLPDTTRHLLRVGALKALEPKLVERTYSTLSLILRTLAPSLLRLDPILRSTWDYVRPYLSTKVNKHYIRKCVANAWSGVLRKARAEGLNRVLHLMLEDEETTGIEAVWANSLRGSPGRLHSRALPIFEMLVDRLAGNPTDQSIRTMTRVITALVHHCTSSTSVPIVEVILARLDPSLTSDPSSSSYVPPPSFAILECLSTLLLTRKGKRYPDQLLKPTMLKLAALALRFRISDDSAWGRSFLSCVVGCLQAGKLTYWLSPGVSLIESVWEGLRNQERFAFATMLVTLKWPGIEQFLLPQVSRAVIPSLSSEPLPTLVLLNNIASAGYFTGGLSSIQGGRWRSALLAALAGVLGSLRDPSLLELDDRRTLGQLLRLLPTISADGFFAPHIVALLSTLLPVIVLKDTRAHIEAWRTGGIWNEAHLLGLLLECARHLAHSPTAEGLLKAELVGKARLQSLVEGFHWNREIMGSIAVFAEIWGSDMTLSNDELRPLMPNLWSADSSLRRSTIRILTATTRTPSTASGTSLIDIWSLCLQIETSEMTLKNVRERTTHIARLGRLLAGLSDDDEASVSMALPDVIGYLVSQLKVNYRPLYAETVAALASLLGRHGEVVWSIIWQEMERVNSSSALKVVDLGTANPDWAVTMTDRNRSQRVEDEDEEGSFQCHNLNKGRLAVQTALDTTTESLRLDAAEVQSQVPNDRLDVLNYEAQLLNTLATTSSLAEKHSRLLVPAFFRLTQQDAKTTSIDRPHLSTKQHQQRTIGYLELFSRFVNPKAVFRSQELHTFYLSVLSTGEPKLQGLALKCLITYKSPMLLPYEENLRTLLVDAQFRDQLTHFALGADSQSINPQHRDEVVPIAIRLLYGILTSRRGRSSTAQGLKARKQAVLTALSGCSSVELSILVHLMLEPFTTTSGDKAKVAGRQQLGFLTLLSDVLRYLGPQTALHWPRLITTTVELVSEAQRHLSSEQTETADLADDMLEDDIDDRVELDKGAAPLRHIRSLGIRRLVQFLRTSTSFDFAPFLPVIFASIVSPRLDKLEIENTQAPSGTLDLITSLAASPETALALVEYDERTLPKVFDCITAVKVKPAVIGRVFDVIESLLVEDKSSITEKVLLPHIHTLLQNLIGLVQNLKQTANHDVMNRLLAILSRLSSVVSDGQQAQQLASLLGPSLRQANKQLSEKGKVNVLNTLRRLYLVSPEFRSPTSDFFSQNFDLVSNLFQTLFFPSSRRALVATLETFVETDPSLEFAVKSVADLNAYSARRLDEPDFDRRLTAFGQLNDAEASELPRTTRDWLPLLRSALFFLQEPEELSIRSNASSLIQRFISVVGEHEDGSFVDSLLNVVIPGLRRVFRSKIELVRNEALQVISHAVKTCTGIPLLAELRVLLAEDEEANFFVNVAHIQVHRRARALRRLRDACSHSNIRETTLSTIFLPVLEHIIAGSIDVTDHHLINEAILSVGSLAGKLRWSRYNALFMRYLRLGKQRSAHQKLYIRVVSSIIDGFHFDLTPAIDTDGVEAGDEVDEQADEDLENEKSAELPSATVDGFTISHISEVVLNRLLPALSDFVSQKGASEDTIRIPLALPTVKLASVLKDDKSSVEILRTITTVSQILRSKDQDTRDTARDTLCKIAVFLGPDWLVRVLKELRSALQRGPQKHVAAVVTHAILVLATQESGDRFGNLDDAVEDAVQVSAEVIWGESGKDVESEGFRTKMREVRGATTRGFDTFQLVARLASPGKIGAVLSPIREILHASQAVKTMQLVDETLRRVAIGLNGNDQLRPSDILSLCYSLISGNSKYIKAKREAPVESKAADSHRVQMKRHAKEEVDFYPLNAHKLVGFGLDLFVTAFRRGRLDFEDTDILSRLGPLVGAVGNALYSTTSSILLLALKATAAIARCPLPQIESALPVFVTNIFKIIKQAGGTAESEIAQTALKTLAVIIRDCKTAEITGNQLKYLLDVIGPDLEESDRQSAIFTILRAVVARRFVVPEIYDLLDRVSSIMVTSQSKHVQESCRGVLMQFLLDYPQGRGRLKAQMTFLARNLDYVYESGRISVMELLSAIFTKFSDELIEEYADFFWVALVAALANDEAENCRTMAEALLKQLFSRMGGRQQDNTLKILKDWLKLRDEQVTLASASLAVYALLAENDDVSDDLLADIIEVIDPVIEESATRLGEAETSPNEGFTLVYYKLPLNAITTVYVIAQSRPTYTEHLPWTAIISHLLFPQDAVRVAAARALAMFVAGPGAFDLLSEGTLLDVARKGCILLQGSRSNDGEVIVVDKNLADQLVKLLFSVTKHWANVLQVTYVAISDDFGDEEHEAPIKGQPLPWLMSRMSFIARHLIIGRPSVHHAPISSTPWTTPVVSILRYFAGVYEHFTHDQAKHFLPHVLNPIYRILDEAGDLTSIDSGGWIDEMRLLATEVRDFVQSKVGTTDFFRAWDRLRRRVNERREGRKDARNRMVVANPQAWAERRDKRGVIKKESKKRKGKASGEAKQMGRPVKRRA